MAQKILMPALSPTMTEGNLANWLKKEGDTVAPGDVIAEIETDKATMELEAVEEGVIAKIIVQAGAENVPVNELIAVLREEDDSDADVEALLSGTGGNDNAKPTPQENKSAENRSEAEAAAPSAPALNTPSTASGERVFASPLAKRLANQNNVNLSQVSGSGPHGRIVKADIEDALKNGVSSAPQTASSGTLPAASGPNAKQLADMLGMAYTEEKNSNMRKTIAQRLTESKVTVPHFYLTVDCRLDNLMAVRKQINTQADGAYKLSVNDFIIKACAQALKDVPAANASWTPEAMIQYQDADISVAVATPTGLITPIVKAAQNKGLRAISSEMKDLASRARDGKLKPTEYQGGTFSLSNLGMFGVKEFAAIINPPQGCILAVGAGSKQPIVDDKGNIVAATVMSATLSVDHRVVDGAVGAQFLAAFKAYIETPAMMLA